MGLRDEIPVTDRAGLRRMRVEHYQSMSVAERFAMTVELMEAGLRMQRLNLRRRNPDASESDIDALLQAWLLARE